MSSVMLDVSRRVIANSIAFRTRKLSQMHARVREMLQVFGTAAFREIRIYT